MSDEVDAAIRRYGDANHALGEMPLWQMVSPEGHRVATEVRAAEQALRALLTPTISEADASRTWKGTRHLFTNADEEASFEVRAMKTREDGGVYILEAMDGEEQSSIYIPPDYLETVAKALWQSPPRLDVEAFERAVEIFGIYQAYVSTTKSSDPGYDRLVEQYNAARADLLAFAPSESGFPASVDAANEAGAECGGSKRRKGPFCASGGMVEGGQECS